MPPKHSAVGKKPPKRKSGELDIGELVRKEIRLAQEQQATAQTAPQDALPGTSAEESEPTNSGPSSMTSTAAAPLPTAAPSTEAVQDHGHTISGLLSDFMAGNLQGESVVPQPLPVSE